MRIAITADHNGVSLKMRLIEWLNAHGHEVDDRVVRVAVENPAADVLAERRVVHDLRADMRAPVFDLVPALLEPVDEPGLQGDAVVVGRDRYAHGLDD